MESSLRPEPEDPRSALAAADQARERLAAALRLPTGLFPALAVAVAVQVGAAAYGIADQSTSGLAIALGGAALFLATAAVLLTRFRNANGVRVDGLASTIILGTGTVSTSVYLATFAAATWAAFEAQWWLVALAAAAGGAAYSFSAHLWWRAYRDDPASRAGGASPRLLAALAVVACLGAVALVVGS
ncbi:hypothetical protein [Pedococcus dokdonensis]|nr:hypothetical protein [Pedococcus dokdonensis]